MKRLLPVFLALIIGAPLAQGEAPLDETRFTLREEFLRIINRDRKQFGLQPVELDAFASSVADAYCRLQIRNGTSGHFTTDGQAPYMRYSFAGGNDGVSENAAAWSANYNFNDRALYEMMRRSQDAMMREVAPHDGHRRTILDPYATHVGIGLAWERGEFRLTQEFVRRYVDWIRPLPRAASTADRVAFSGRPAGGLVVEAITVHHEPTPEPIAVITANALTKYGLPDARRDYLPRLRSRFHRTAGGGIQEVREMYSDGRRGDFPISEDGTFSFQVPFTDGPGVYTVVVWVRANGAREAIAASNVSIRVNESADASAAVSFSSR
jgi:uncharacterized protein YkwD